MATETESKSSFTALKIDNINSINNNIETTNENNENEV